jgi:hypothetical protein
VAFSEVLSDMFTKNSRNSRYTTSRASTSEGPTTDGNAIKCSQDENLSCSLDSRNWSTMNLDSMDF